MILKGRGGRPSTSTSGARISETRCGMSEEIIEALRRGWGRGRIITANSTVFNVLQIPMIMWLNSVFSLISECLGALIMGCMYFCHNLEIEKRKLERQ